MTAAAAAVGATFLDPEPNFKGKAICGDRKSVHAVTTEGKSEADNPGIPPSMEPFHPKISGATLYTDALERASSLRAPGAGRSLVQGRERCHGNRRRWVRATAAPSWSATRWWRP
ncbi:hypothetical protein [Streptomyces sp. NBC_01716]|uniref:hypothetical protein n=1 Tax=Streptomyces sp. NBC_01716 TaxID=2975917 RepID=UPI002E3234C6|nr:hypothetical protein [Streptomyces sp. NBC_01716]